MSSGVSTTNSTNHRENYPPDNTIAAADNDIVSEADDHHTHIHMVQAGPAAGQSIPSSMASDHSDNINGLNLNVGGQTSAIVSVSVEGSQPQPQRISIHPKLYKAAGEGDVNFLREFLQSQEMKEAQRSCDQEAEFQQLDGMSQLEGLTVGHNTLLHIAANSSNRHCRWFRPKGKHIEFAREVYSRNRSLLMARNKLSETPLHCAVKAENYRMVSLLISFAEDEHQVGEETLLMARNMHGETALHEAVRIGHTAIVKELVRSEPRLIGIVDDQRVSPLYLAVMTNAFEIVQVFTTDEPSLASCAGPRGQTALHTAVLEHTGITRELLEWYPSLATQVDDNGSTPLHYAVSAGHLDTIKLLLEKGSSAAYIADKNGLYPIHVAAKCGNKFVVDELMEQVPDSDELLDNDGRNFLHISIMSGKASIMYHIYHWINNIFQFWKFLGLRNLTYLRMVNARDYQGNTPLHLACQKRRYHIVGYLIATKVVCSSIMNRDGLTPVDLSLQTVDRGFRYTLNKPYNILRCLLWTGALPSPRRVDQLDDDLNIVPINKTEELKKAESATQTLGIISVLIATVTFAAIFTMPGGYIADDHVNHGTPILSQEYTFKAFVVADLLAFALSIITTAWLIYAGFSIVDLRLRLFCASVSTQLLKVAVKATVFAFALAAYTVLSHVNLPLSMIILVAPFVFIPVSNPSYWSFLFLAKPIKGRSGCIALCKPHYLISTRRRVTVGVGFSYLHIVIFEILVNLLLYVIIFQLALK